VVQESVAKLPGDQLRASVAQVSAQLFLCAAWPAAWASFELSNIAGLLMLALQLQRELDSLSGKVAAMAGPGAAAAGQVRPGGHCLKLAPSHLRAALLLCVCMDAATWHCTANRPPTCFACGRRMAAPLRQLAGSGLRR
jgi:hypothetical protein